MTLEEKRNNIKYKKTLLFTHRCVNIISFDLTNFALDFIYLFETGPPISQAGLDLTV